MSRIGKQPIPLPKGVELKTQDGLVTVKGPKGQLTQQVDPELEISVNGQQVEVKRPKDTRKLRAQHGLARTLIANMVTGVSEGFKRSLQIIGVGYRAAAAGKGLELQLGFSHPVKIDPIDGIDFEVEIDNRAKINKIHISGIDKQKVGQVAANLRSIRPPEPYKGKGIRYVDEVIIKKMGKAGKA